jgi:hypothetical protein
MNIVTFGDSFTYGEELSDTNNAWPAVLASMMGAGCNNLGTRAASNDEILRKLVTHTMTDVESVYVVAWTFPGRQEYADATGHYSVWPGYEGKLFIATGEFWRKEQCDYLSRHHDPVAMLVKYYQQVLLAQRYLESMGIKYVMLCVNENEFYKNQYSLAADVLKEKINKHTFIDFGLAGMSEWIYAKYQGNLAMGPKGHFLDDGHRVVAEKIYDTHFRN